MLSLGRPAPLLTLAPGASLGSRGAIGWAAATPRGSGRLPHLAYSASRVQSTILVLMTGLVGRQWSPGAAGMVPEEFRRSAPPPSAARGARAGSRQPQNARLRRPAG